jgi:hypothetical protein
MLDAPAPALARPQATCEMTHSADQKFHRDFPAGLRRDFSGEESHEQSLLEPALKADSIFLGSAARTVTLPSVCVYSHLESTSGAFHLLEMARMYLRPAMPVVVLLCLSLIAQGISGQLTGVAGGLDSDACVNETRTMKDIISGGRSETEGFFAGGLRGAGAYKRYGCWRKHACLDAINAAGVDTAGDAICYKFHSAQHSW